MRGAIEGEIPVGEVLAEEAYLCLGCRACETACPSGVEFGAILEEAARAGASESRAGPSGRCCPGPGGSAGWWVPSA
jgi:glycolate oxidase iron-sulfur subunit